MTDFIGRLDSVYTRQFAAMISETVPAGGTVITVDAGEDLDVSGSLMTPWDSATYSYTFDGDATVTLASPLLSDAEQGEALVVWDPLTSAPVVDTVAHVATLGTLANDDIVEARVPSALMPLLAEGIRAEGEGESVLVQQEGNAYVVAEMLGQAAVIDGTMIDPDSLSDTIADATAGLADDVAQAQADATAAGAAAADAVADAAAASSAAAAAQAEAESAGSAADAAQIAADGAQTTADGKAKVTYSNVAPTTSTPGKPGDMWFVQTGSPAQVTGQYVCTAGTGTTSGNTWTAQQMTNTVIATLDAAKITTGVLAAARIAGETITADKIAANAITSAKINAGAVVAGKIATDAVTAGTIAAGAVTAGKIAAEAVTTEKIAAGAVTAGTIAAGAITAAHLVANNALFEALQAEDITGVNITGSVITGTELRTAASGNYWRLGSSGALARIESVPALSTGIYQTPGVDNLGQENTTQQAMGSQVSGGTFVLGAPLAYIAARAVRERTSPAEPWGPEKSILQGRASDEISLAATAAGGEATISAEHISLSTYPATADSVEILTGNLTLGGAYGVAINGDATVTGSLKMSTDTDWVNLPLLSGYTPVSGETPQYRRVGDQVHLRGRISGPYGTGLTACASLPAGFRPVLNETVWMVATSSTANSGRIAINSAGDIRIGIQSATTISASVHGSFFVV